MSMNGKPKTAGRPSPNGRGTPTPPEARDVAEGGEGAEAGGGQNGEHAQAATAAGLRYVTDALAGIRRVTTDDGFIYVGANGHQIRNEAKLKRIRSLAIPPAWTDVWICPYATGHLQVTARDAKGRKQYRYHPRFRAVRDETKFDRMVEFSRVLPRIRERVEEHMAKRGLPREKVLATVVRLLEKTLIRVGNQEYAKENQTFGLTTLQRQHVQVEGTKLRFHFRGKSGKVHSVSITDRRLARIVQRCQTLPGEELFQYEDDVGKLQTIDSGDINEYLRTIAKREITAKDFRTWAGTMLAAGALREMGRAKSKREAKSNVNQAIDQVAQRLGNTRTVCRRYYIHPTIIAAYMKGRTVPHAKRPPPKKKRRHTLALRRDELAVLDFLNLDGRKPR
jgi:DNA topoisomerase I